MFFVCLFLSFEELAWRVQIADAKSISLLSVCCLPLSLVTLILLVKIYVIFLYQ